MPCSAGILRIMKNTTTQIACIVLATFAFAHAEGPSQDTTSDADSAPAQEVVPKAPERTLRPDGTPLVFGDTIRLFNGENLSNWTAHFVNGSTDPSDAFRVEDGILKCKGQPIGYIRTRVPYESFRLVVEWRFDPEVGGGNSGVLMRLTGKDTVWPNSIEAQLNSRDAGDIWNIGEFPMKTDPKRVSGRRTRKMAPTNEKPLGEWNRYDILLDGERLELKVNGMVQNTATECAEIKGFIGLQSEGVAIEFRTVELQPIINQD